MASADFKLLQELFARVVELPSERWQTWIDQEVPEALRPRLERLLRRHRGDGLIDEQAAASSLTSAMRQALPGAFIEGQQIDEYAVIKLLGRGGMGSVYLAEHEAAGITREVALKLIRPQDMNPELMRRFSNERRLLAALDHPGICKFLDAGALPDGTPYVVMELVRGEPLLDYCNARRLGVRERVQLLRKIAVAVEYAHSQLIVHRDIKPSNVLVDEHGEPKLLDFGIAKSISDEGDADLTATAQRFLTPGSAAPEQLLGEPIGVGCDVYMLGNLAYQLLAGAPPFDIEGLRAAEIERLTLQVPPELMSRRVLSLTSSNSQRCEFDSPTAHARQLAGDLDSIVAKCLRKAPSERYANGAELIADLTRFLEGHPVLARGGERGYRLRKFLGRHKLAATLTASLVAVLLVGASALAFQAYRLAEQRNAALLERDRANQVVYILREAFTASDPAGITQGAQSVAEVLRNAQSRIESLAEGQPELFLSLADTIAEVEISLGMDSDAVEILNRAVLAESLTDLGEPVVRARRLRLVNALTATGRREDAMELLLRNSGPIDSEDPDWLLARARLDRAMGQFALAADRVDAALAHTPDDDATILRANQLRWLAIDLARERLQFERATQLVESTLAWQAATLRKNHPWLSLTEIRLIVILQKLGKMQEAVAVAERTHAEMRQQYGDGSPMAGKSAQELGLALSAAGRHDEARPLLEEAVSSWERTLGPQHELTIKAVFNLAIAMYRAKTETKQTAALFLDAADRAFRRFGPRSDTTHYMRNAAMSFLLQSGDAEAALKLGTGPGAHEGLEELLPANLQRHLEFLRRSFEAVCDGSRAHPGIERDCRDAESVLSRSWSTSKRDSDA